MIDLAPWLALAALIAGLTVAWARDHRRQIRVCKARNSQPLRVYTMNLPDVATIRMWKVPS